MARKTNQGRRKGTKSVSKAALLENPIDLRKLNGGGYKKVIRSLYKSPIALYLASGVGSYFAVRFLFRYYKDHPEIAEFVRDNFESVESRIREFRGGSAMDEDMARH